MKQVTIVYSNAGNLTGALQERQEKAQATLERNVEDAMLNINKPDQTPYSSGYTPAQVGRIQIREAKTWYLGDAYGTVSIIVR